MASLDHRLNPLFSIKECMTCGALYTRNCGCSKGSLEDKILVPKPPQNCATCGNPVDGLYCRSCAFVRKCLNEGWYTIHDENEILNTSESSKHNTNVVSTPREPFVFNQDPGVNSSQSPLQSNHNCCYKCGDSLDDIFCQQCTCKSCGNGAHIGYNCPPKAPIISNSEQCNQTIAELPQTLPSVHPTCNSGDENSFTYDSKPNFANDSPNVFNPQPQYVPYSCELCGNESHYGYDCPPQVPFVYNQDPCFNQNFDYFPQTSPSFPQQYPCCEDCGGPHETFQCQPMNEDYYHEQNSCYDSNSFGFDQTQPPQYTVHHPIFNVQNDLLNSQNKLMEQMTSICDMVGQIMQKKEEERRIAEDQAAKDRYWKIPICYDEDEDYTIAITPVLSTKEPVDSLIMEDEHLDTIPATESDEVIKSSVEEFVPIPSESEGISDGMCDVPLCENPTPLKAFKNHSEIVVDSNNDGTSSDDDSYENIEYVEASLLNLEYDSLEEVNEDQEEEEFDLEDIFQIQDVILREKLLNISRLVTNIESLKDNPTPDYVFKSPSSFPIPVVDSDSFFEKSDTSLSHLDNSLPEFEIFSDHTEETRSGRLTGIVISDNSNNPLLELPEFESFHFDLDPSFPCPPPEPPDVEINLIIETDAPEINNVDELNEDECFDPGGGENNVEVDDSFTIVTRTFLPFLTYPEVSPVLSSTKNEDTIYDPDIFT
ncbi:hypothetical protein Tco_0251866 [Tanacetum coccineum]